MFASLLQALGVNSSFFVQFSVFLLFYPVLSRLLFRPYFHLHNQREQETVERMKQAEQLLEKKQNLQEKYKKKAYIINEAFNKMYNQKSKSLKEHFVNKKMQEKQKIQREFEKKQQAFLKEVSEVEKFLQSEVKGLTKVAVDRLVS